MDGRDIVEIAGHYGTPLYIGSEQRIEDNVREVQQAFQKYHANTTVHYAAKAETSLATLEIVHMAGGSLEVNSGGELYKGCLLYTSVIIIWQNSYQKSRVISCIIKKNV